MANMKRFTAKKLWSGKAEGPALVTRERISFSGGTIDPKRGLFVSSVTELKGASFAGAVLFYTSGKGPTSGASVLDVACRSGNAPAAIINLEIDPITALACALQNIPFMQIDDPSIFDQVKNGDWVSVDAEKGEIIIRMLRRLTEEPLEKEPGGRLNKATNQVYKTTGTKWLRRIGRHDAADRTLNERTMRNRNRGVKKNLP